MRSGSFRLPSRGRKESGKLRRLRQVRDSIEETGTWELTAEELKFGARTAWRNAPRCPGRIQWQNLKLRDCRDVRDLRGAFDALCDHIVYSTNKGNIRPAITIFPSRGPEDSGDPIRIWNKVLH